MPGYTAFLHRLSKFARVITFDKRGQGLSDRISGAPSLEQRMDDVRAVMDDIGSRRAVLLGFSEGCAMSATFAASYPERVSHLILFGGMTHHACQAEPIDQHGGWCAYCNTSYSNATPAGSRFNQSHRVAVTPSASCSCAKYSVLKATVAPIEMFARVLIGHLLEYVSSTSRCDDMNITPVLA